MATVTKMCDLIDTTGGTGPFTTPSFTPPAGSLLVFLINASNIWNNTGDPILTDTDGGGWWHAGNLTFDEVAGDGGYESITYAVRTGPVSGASMTLSISPSGVTQDSVIATVLAVEGMALFGINAIAQGAYEPNRYQTGVPSVTFDAPCSRANPVIAWIITDSAPPNIAPPTGFTEWTDDYVTGQTLGMHAASIDGGFTGPTIPYTQDPDGVHRARAFELDTTGGTPWIARRTLLAVNGLPLDVEYGSWKEERLPIGPPSGESLGGQEAVGVAGAVRRWTCTLTPHGVRTATGPAPVSTDHLARLAKWIEGQGQSWSFDSASHSYSGAGVTNAAIGTFTRSASGGLHGGRITIGSSSVFGVDMRQRLYVPGGWDPTQGWTLMCHRLFQAGESVGAGWHHAILTGAVAFARGSAANPTGVTQYVDGVAGSYNLGRCFSVDTASPFVGLHGYLTTDANAAIEFDDWVFLPFALPAAWVAAPGDSIDNTIEDYVSSHPWPPLPRVGLGGKWVDPEEAYPGIKAIGRVRGSRLVQVLDGGVVHHDVPALELEFTEWVD